MKQNLVFENFILKFSENSEWCEIYENGKFKGKLIDEEEARRYIWLQLKGTPDEIEYLSRDMMQETEG